MPLFLLILMLVGAVMFPPLSAIAAAVLGILMVTKKRVPSGPATVAFVKDDGTIVHLPVGH